MASVFQWLLRLTAGAIIAIVAVGCFVYYLAARSLPDYTATLEVAGISAPIEIVRDTADVPHILGETDTDSYFGLGYAHAQDRLWQMTVMRRTAQGRLSEIFGMETLASDSLMRRLDIYGQAVSSVEAQDAYTKAALLAYARGVNTRLEEINQSALGRGAPEMFLYTTPLAPWRPADSIAILKLLGVQNATHLQTEVLRAQVSFALPDPDRIKDLMPDAPGNGVAALPEYASFFDAPFVRTATYRAPEHQPLSPFGPRAFAGASNAWAAATTRSAAGGTLLANDPHSAFTAPTQWYLARLRLASGDVIGGTIPGLPVVMLGRSEKLAWGMTSSFVDDQDVFVEQLNPDNVEEYRIPGGFAPFETRSSIVAIKDAPPVTLTLRWTQNGPVLPDADFNLGLVTPTAHVASLGWTLLDEQDASVSALMGLMRAGSVTEGISAGAGYVAPSKNVMLIDQSTIAMKTFGTMPRRDARHQSQGRLPTPGWRGENRWLGLAPYVANPEYVAPTGGILGNTNNKIVERPFPNHLSFDWGDTQRIQRWQRLMQIRQVHTRDSFIEAQLDTVSFTARTLLPLIGAELWFSGAAAPEGTKERERQRALQLLADWNGEMSEHLPEPLIYSIWIRKLQDRMIRDELGPVADGFPHVEPLFIERAFRDIEGAAAWCDVIQSETVETCPEMAALALEDALVWLEDRYGTTLESLRWGDAHQAAHNHPVLGDAPIFRAFANIRQSTSGGDQTLMRGLTLGSEADPFLNVHGAGYRGVYDMADPDSSIFIISTGQSGHMLSRHYDDMAQLWRRGEYIPMSLDVDLARAAAVGVTTLVPAP